MNSGENFNDLCVCVCCNQCRNLKKLTQLSHKEVKQKKNKSINSGKKNFSTHSGEKKKEQNKTSRHVFLIVNE